MPKLDIATSIGASVVGLNTAALLLLFYAVRPSDADARKERRLLNLKRIRIGTFVVVTVGQAAICAWRASQHKFILAMYDAQMVSTGLLWALTAVFLMVTWSRQGSVSLLPVVLISLVVIGMQMAMDCLHNTDNMEFTHDDRITGVSLHTAELGALFFVCMAESLYGHFASLPLSELEEPLFDKTEKEKAKEAEKRFGKKRSSSRTQRTARAFRYVWPDSRPLRLRLVACFTLVIAERCVNLAVPVLYKNMVDQLSSSVTGDNGDENGSPGVLKAALHLARAALQMNSAAAAASSSRSGGGNSSTGVHVSGASGVAAVAAVVVVDAEAHGQLMEAAYGLLKASQQVSFWTVFYPWVFAYLGFYFLRGGSGMEGLLANMRDLVWIPITQAAFRRISLDVFGHLLDLDHAFHLHRKTGQIMRILDRGTSSIQDTVSIVLFNVIPQLIDIVVACTYLAFKMQPWAAVIVFITVASYVPLTVIITERRGVIRKRMNALDNAREGRATDMLLNYETVKYFCNEKFELAVYDNATRQYQAAEYWQMAFLAMLSITQASVVWLGLASGMVVCVRGVVRSSLTVGDAVLFVTMMNQLYVPLTFFGSYYRQVQKALIDMENMFELLDTEPSVKDLQGAGQLSVGAARVDFDQVVFGYTATSPPVLRGVSFTVPGGKTLAVVGATGSGKSTILRLLLRFYDPRSGRVLLDGQDIKRVSQESLRRAVAVVPQDTVMFNDTVLYNIRYGRTDATEEEVMEAAAVAHIHQSIMTTFKKHYATRVGERGLRLSGGEKQRVAFARAVLKRPAVLVLDEATSALDSLTELAIQSSLQTLRGRCTTVIVAHRLSTIIDADLILVLNRGEVAQCGSHAELMEEGGLYAAMWSRQQDTAGYTTPILGMHSGGGVVTLPTAVSGPRVPALTSTLSATSSFERTTNTTEAANGTGGATAVLPPPPPHHSPPPPKGGADAEGQPPLRRIGPCCMPPLPPHPPLSCGAGIGSGGGSVGVSVRHHLVGRDDTVSPLPSLPGRTAVGAGGLPRVPSRLMRRAIMSDEMSEAGDHGALSRNPTPSRRARALEEDEADELLYEDRDPDEQAEASGGTSPDRRLSPRAGYPPSSMAFAGADLEAPLPVLLPLPRPVGQYKRPLTAAITPRPANGELVPHHRGLHGHTGQPSASMPAMEHSAAPRLEQLRNGGGNTNGGNPCGSGSGSRSRRSCATSAPTGAARRPSAFESPTAAAVAVLATVPFPLRGGFGAPMIPPEVSSAAATADVTAAARLQSQGASGSSSGASSPQRSGTAPSSLSLNSFSNLTLTPNLSPHTAAATADGGGRSGSSGGSGGCPERLCRALLPEAEEPFKQGRLQQRKWGT